MTPYLCALTIWLSETDCSQPTKDAEGFTVPPSAIDAISTLR